MNPLLYTSFLISFFVTFLSTPYWISRARKAGLVGTDMHKQDKKEVAELGGISVIFGFLIGILLFIAFRIFIIDNPIYILEILALISTMLIITIIGMIDDILGWKIGLRQWQKPVLTLIAALPIMVINVGHSTMNFPIFGPINFGIFFPLILTPIAIVGAANGFNMLAGYNGLEAGQGILILSAMAYISWTQNNGRLAVIALCMVFSLAAFYYYNKYPAKIFPGDTLTYSVGALIATIAILGNMEKAAVIMFTPYFIQLILKSRGKFKKESFTKITESGTLELKYPEIYGIEHAAVSFLKKLKLKSTETNVVHSIFIFQILFIILAIA